MKLILKEEHIFIPEFEGNKKLPDSEQIKVHWRYPSAEDTKEIRVRSNPKMKYSKGKVKSDDIEFEIIVNDILAVKKLVVNIENLEVNGRMIKDAESLLKTPALSGLVTEISNEILLHMDEVKENSKNS